MLGLSILAFLSFVVYILNINQEVLYTAHGRSEFICGIQYFQTLMSKPFGLMQYVGGWFTQFFYEPTLGASMLLAIWILIFIVGVKAYRLQGSASALMLLPVACLFTSIVDLGYWIYIFTIRGYWFSQSLGYLAMLLLLWAASRTPRRWHIVWYLFAFCLYPLIGWFALLFVLCLMLVEKPSWQEIAGIVVILFSAGIWRTLLYSNVKFEDVWFAGFPRFDTPSDKSELPSVPFWMLGMVSLLIVLLKRYLLQWFVPLLCSVVGITFVVSFMYYDKNYINEMRMAHHVENDEWKEVLSIYEESTKHTASMVMFKNLALMNEGGLLDRSFKMGNECDDIYSPDTIHVSFLEIASPVAYYNYGMMNEGFRLNFECAEQSGFSPLYLKMLCRTAFANGERELVKRYVTLLHGHPFYRDWQPAPVTNTVRELQRSYSDELSGVENSYSYIVNSISLWYESDSKVASEQALFFSMMRCDSHRFWPSLRNYLKCHQGEEFPMHAQEAYIMFLDKAPEARKMKIPVSEEAFGRYKSFWTTLETKAKSGMSKESIMQEMRMAFGDTYWYYNIFGRKIL